MAKSKTTNTISVEERLKRLYELQEVHSKMTDIIKLKGELPMEVQDLEDEIIGLETRLGKMSSELKSIELDIVRHNAQIKESEAAILKYEGQQENVRNNREYDALSREINLQQLDIQLAQKRIGEARRSISNKELTIEATTKKAEDRKQELERKREELKKIAARTEKEERSLEKKEKKARKGIPERLLRAYDRVRTAYRNGLGVVTVEREACGGCFNQVPPQIQLEIRQRKRIIPCEHCGRIFVDKDMFIEPLPTEEGENSDLV